MSSTTNDLLRAGIFVIAMAVCNVSVLAQTSQISGQVFGQGRRPVADVQVELLNDVGSVVKRFKTDAVGGFYFNGLYAGRFAIRVRPFGTDYEEQTVDVELNTFVGGRNVPDQQRRDIYLRSRRDSARKPGVPGVIFAQEVPPNAKKAYDSGVENLEAKRLEPGIADLKNAVSLFPTYFLALERLGIELVRQQQWSEALQYFERAVAVNDKSATSWYGVAFSSFGTGAYARSMEAGTKASNLSPDSPDIQLIFGLSLRQNGKYKDAEEALLKAKKLFNGKSPDLHWNLALLYAHNLKNYRNAATELEAYLKLKPDHPSAELLRKLISQWRAGQTTELVIEK